MNIRRPFVKLTLLFVVLIVMSSCSISGDDDDEEPTDAADAVDTPAIAASSPTNTEESAQAADTAAPASTATLEPSSATEVQVSTALGPCSAIELVRAFETPAPVTPEPAPEPTATQSGPQPTPEPTETLAPAPSEDRIGFPEGYPDNFHLLYVFDRPDNVQVRVICGNDMAAMAQPGEPLPYGSVLLMETWRAQRNEDDSPVLDDNGRFIREELSGIFLMKKEEGFGEAYGDQRSGEWEYVAYRPNGEYLAPPERTNACSACHQIAGDEKDYVFRLGLFFDPEGASTAPEVGENEVNIFDYTFMPARLEVTVGTTVTWVNNDVVAHTVMAEDGSFDSGVIDPGGSFSFTFEQAGEFPYTSDASRNIKPGTIVVME